MSNTKNSTVGQLKILIRAMKIRVGIHTLIHSQIIPLRTIISWVPLDSQISFPNPILLHCIGEHFCLLKNYFTCIHVYVCVLSVWLCVVCACGYS